MRFVTVIECTKNILWLTVFARDASKVITKHSHCKELQSSPKQFESWIAEVTQALKELAHQQPIKNTAHFILPGFCILNKTINVPNVSKSKQRSVIASHLQLDTPLFEDLHFEYQIINSNLSTMEVGLTLIKKDWLQAFCNAIESAGINVSCIAPPPIHLPPDFKTASMATAHNLLLKKEPSINLIPKSTHRAWNFAHNKPWLIATVSCFALSFSLLTYHFNKKIDVYNQKLEAIKENLTPLKERNHTLDQYLQEVARTHELINSLENYTHSKTSWPHFLDQLQNMFFKTQNTWIHSIKNVNPHQKSTWEEDLMSYSQESSIPHNQQIQLEGRLFTNIHDDLFITSKVKTLISKINALNFVKEITNVQLSTQDNPIAKFSFIITIHPQDPFAQ